MAKKCIALLLLVCILGSMVSGCKAKITAQEAADIVLSELGTVEPDEAPHVHPSNHNGKACFNVFVTVDGNSMVYIVSDTGDILAHGPSDHHH